MALKVIAHWLLMRGNKPCILPALGLISANTAKWGNPLGLRKSDCAAWADGLDLPNRGETILYTGCEYQIDLTP
ncbi:MAG: hypothetical protein DRI01_07265 [Chloroflexi bacterium]|nr:MAG: hypothetical protein DRI01_07265 [Chloroflexota bacterium]